MRLHVSDPCIACMHQTWSRCTEIPHWAPCIAMLDSAPVSQLHGCGTDWAPLTSAYRLLDSATVSQLHGCVADLSSIACAYHVLPRCWTVHQSIAWLWHRLSSVDCVLIACWTVRQSVSCMAVLPTWAPLPVLITCCPGAGQCTSQLRGCGTDWAPLTVLVTCWPGAGQCVSQLHGCVADLSSVDMCLSLVGQCVSQSLAWLCCWLELCWHVLITCCSGAGPHGALPPHRPLHRLLQCQRVPQRGRDASPLRDHACQGNATRAHGQNHTEWWWVASASGLCVCVCGGLVSVFWCRCDHECAWCQDRCGDWWMGQTWCWHHVLLGLIQVLEGQTWCWHCLASVDWFGCWSIRLGADAVSCLDWFGCWSVRFSADTVSC